MIQTFGTNIENRNSEVNFMRILDEIIISEFSDDPNFNIENWSVIPKKKIDIETYMSIKDILGDILFIKYSLILLLLLYIKILCDLNEYNINMQTISNAFINNIWSIYFIVYFVGALYCVIILYKENQIYNKLNYDFDMFRNGDDHKISFILCQIMGTISRFLEISHTIIFSFIFICIFQYLNLIDILLILVVKLSFFIIHIRLYSAINNLNGNSITTNDNIINTQNEDAFTINQIFDTLFLKSFFSNFINLFTENNLSPSLFENHVKPLKILQLSDFTFTLDLYLIENELYKRYIINRHKETHEFNISIYYLWKILCKEIPLNVLKIFILMFMNIINKRYLILSFILSNISIISTFIYIYINKQVISDLLN